MRIQGQLVCIAPFASPKLLISPPLLSLRATFGNEFSGLDCHYPCHRTRNQTTLLTRMIYDKLMNKSKPPAETKERERERERERGGGTKKSNKGNEETYSERTAQTTQDIDMELISSAHGCLSSHHIHHYSYRVMNTINSGVINLEKFDRGSLSTGLFA